ncbi:MAG: BON domain-containing protein [Deltaproteobacteria bacterium]|nr:MAG: BON domain-containing protein [Deltaproteobacteria bacterium]
MAQDSVRADESADRSSQERAVGPGRIVLPTGTGATSGPESTGDLYNRALAHANSSEFVHAERTLNHLLSLDPRDGEALLLQAKVRAGLARYADAIDSLTRAEQAGARPAPELRARIEAHLQATRVDASERRAAQNAREEGEISALRQEARRLRSENARLIGRTHDLSREIRYWAWATTGVATFAGLFIVINLAIGVFQGRPPAADAQVAASASDPAAVASAPTDAASAEPSTATHETPEVAPPPPAGSAIAEQARQALDSAPGLDGTSLELAIQSGKATISGTVQTARQRRRAQEVVAGVSGIVDVNTDKVTNLARTRGTNHTVVSGDNLSAIALQYYGDATLAKKILSANKKLGGRPNLQIGMELKIPAVD